MKKAMRLAPDTGRNTVNTQPERRMFVCEVSVWGESLDCEILAIMKRERARERARERESERTHASGIISDPEWKALLIACI